MQYRVERFPDEVEKENPLWLPDRKIIKHHQKEKPYYDEVTDQDIPMASVVHIYNIKAESVIVGGEGHQFIKTTFNFRDCNIGLQGNLNHLGELLTESGNKEEAKELQNAAKALEQVENSKSKAEIKKKGIANRLKLIVQALEDKNSILHKSIRGIKNGISIGQEIVKRYNELVGWLG